MALLSFSGGKRAAFPRLFIAATALCLALLGGCMPISMNTEELLVPPRLNQKQTKVEEALSATLNLSDILYRYPQRGNHRSPFVFYDMDGDGRQEAIVFYAYRSDSQSVRARLLRENDGGDYVQVRDLAGDGDQIDFIRFDDILGENAVSLLIGWQDTKKGSSTLGVYTFAQTELKPEVEVGYLNLSVDDYFGDGRSEVLLISQDSSGAYQLDLLGRTADGRLDILDELPLAPDLSSILQMRRGIIDGRFAVYIDERRADGYYSTEVVRVSRSGLESLVGDESFELYSETFRDAEVLCVDLRGDGTVEIPTLTELPGYISADELEPPPLTNYIRLVSSAPSEPYTFNTIYSAVVNEDAGYLVFFPERWRGNVTVQRRPESNEWQFYKVDSTTDLATTELLRIRVYSTRDYQDRFTSNYISLAEKGVFQYKAHIPATADEPLAITRGELESLLFMLL